MMEQAYKDLQKITWQDMKSGLLTRDISVVNVIRKTFFGNLDVKRQLTRVYQREVKVPLS